jgi:c-di-GMP-binding flagellar brake protein YcgR
VLERLSKWFSSYKTANKALKQPAQNWTGEELELILWCEQQRTLGQMEIPARSGVFHSALLAVDIIENQLLIDVPFPSPPIDLLLAPAAFKISFYKQQQLLQLDVRVVEHLIFQGKPALLVQIEARSFHCDRRASFRISFERSQSPLMRIQIPMAEQLRASVLNLSSGGALLNIFGKHDEFNPLKSCMSGKLQLDDGMCIDVKCEVKTINYYRRPCQHTQLRVQFTQMSAQDQRKLTMFLAFQQDRIQSQVIPERWVTAG